MRINVYAEELTNQVELVTKTLEDGRKFYAVRLFLESSSKLHNTLKDDDRSGITFWVPWTKEKGNNFNVLEEVMISLNVAAHSLVDMNKSGKI